MKEEKRKEEKKEIMVLDSGVKKDEWYFCCFGPYMPAFGGC